MFWKAFTAVFGIIAACVLIAVLFFGCVAAVIVSNEPPAKVQKR